ncbi:hypothetical protein G6F68_014192 [Rhizopus microsporus]|nr:hypothetical protein G6F68_014192 [Rhizopus microsporus]
MPLDIELVRAHIGGGAQGVRLRQLGRRQRQAGAQRGHRVAQHIAQRGRAGTEAAGQAQRRVVLGGGHLDGLQAVAQAQFGRAQVGTAAEQVGRQALGDAGAACAQQVLGCVLLRPGRAGQQHGSAVPGALPGAIPHRRRSGPAPVRGCVPGAPGWPGRWRWTG